MKTLPVHGIIRQNYFQTICRGGNAGRDQKVCQLLGDYNVQVILDYGVEGKEAKKNFDHAADEFIKVINYAADRKNSFISIKLLAWHGLVYWKL